MTITPSVIFLLDHASKDRIYNKVHQIISLLRYKFIVLR